MAQNWKEMLQSHGIKEEQLSADARADIQDYYKIEKSKLPTILKDGKFTPNAQAKLDRLNKHICTEITDYLVDEEDKQEQLAAEKKKKDDAEAERLRLEEIEKHKNDPPPPTPPSKKGLVNWLWNK